MQALLLKIIVISTTVVPLYFGLHELVYEAHHYLRTHHDSSAVYVIGDSRTFDAVDVTALREQTGRTVYSYAQHAMSAYSVFKMSEMVPPGATVLFGPSWGMLVRDKSDAHYSSGFSLRGLQLLLQNDGEYWHFRRIFVINRIPTEAPFFRNTPYPLEESDVRNMGNLEEVRGFYAGEKPPWTAGKKAIIEEAIKTLLAKGCRIEVVEIPIPPDTKALRDASYGSVIDALPVLQNPNVRIHRDIPFTHPEGKNVWQDADHMNARGRRLMTAYLRGIL